MSIKWSCSQYEQNQLGARPFYGHPSRRAGGDIASSVPLDITTSLSGPRKKLARFFKKTPPRGRRRTSSHPLPLPQRTWRRFLSQTFARLHFGRWRGGGGSRCTIIPDWSWEKCCVAKFPRAILEAGCEGRRLWRDHNKQVIMWKGGRQLGVENTIVAL